MTILVVYPNKLDKTKREFTPVDCNQTLDQWMLKNIGGYHASDTPPFSYFVNSKQLTAKDWSSYRWQSDDLIELYAEPRDPITAILVVVAVIAAGVAIHAMHQIPDNFQKTSPSGSPIYSANTQGNRPRLMGIIPELFGTHKTYPDIISEPHWYYSGDVEYQLMLLAVSVGEIDLDDDHIYIADTPVSMYGEDINIQLFSPDEDVTSHPAHQNIYTSREVGATSSTTGIELKNGESTSTIRAVRIVDDRITRLSDVDGLLSEYWPAEWEIDHVLVLSNAGLDNGRYIIKAIDENYATMQKLSGSIQLGSWTNFLGQGDRNMVIYSENGFNGSAAGPFFACPVAETTDQISIDIRFGDGIGYFNDNGDITRQTLSLVLEWRGEGETVWNKVPFSRSGATKNQLGNTIVIDLPRKIRPEVRAYRTTTERDDTRYFDKIELVRLKSRLEANRSYADFTTMAVSIRGSNALSRSAENKLGAIPTRKLQIPNGFGGWTKELYSTRDIAPVLRYIMLDSGLTDLQIGQHELLRLHEVWKRRKDTFDAVFTDTTTLFEALKMVLAVGYAEPTLNFGQIVPVRDEPRRIFDTQFQPDNMLSKGLERSVKLADESEPDGVEVEYFSTDTWKPETVLCLLDDDLGLDPEKVRAFGITSRTKAWQFGMRVRRKKRYRRISYSFETEMDAFNSNYLDYIALGDDVPGYVQSGRIEGCYAENGKTYLTLDIDVNWKDGTTHHIALRRPDGKTSGPYICTPTNHPFMVIIAGNLDFVPVYDGLMEPTLWLFGAAERWCYPALVDDITPQGIDKCAVRATNYDPRVYLDDDNDPPNAIKKRHVTKK